jgi:hypothetical protein
MRHGIVGMTKREPTAPATPPDQKSQERARIASERNAERPQRVEVAFRVEDGVAQVDAPHSDRKGFYATLLDAFGTSSPTFVEQEIMRLDWALRNSGEATAGAGKFNAALAAIDGSQPQNEQDAMLVAQMAATHALAMEFIGRTRRAATTEQLHAFGALATRLLRTFTMQTEALAKVKRGGEQTVRVEHVYVYPGGQAIVGVQTTAARGPGAQLEIDGRPGEPLDPRAIAIAPGAALPGEDAGRDALPAGGGGGTEEMPAARGRAGKRRATR